MKCLCCLPSLILSPTLSLQWQLPASLRNLGATTSVHVFISDWVATSQM